ncbi:MAG: sulfotransferase [Planctomycetaceae bacterium]
MNLPTPNDSSIPTAPRSTAGYLNNFRDPIGLAKRMIFSGNRAAHWSMVREVLRPLVMPLDVVLQVAERRAIRKAGTLSKPILLIVGPPRSGTTVLYQLLADALETTWFPNVSEMFPRSPITASRVLAFKRNKSRRLRSFYGQTPGLSAPNDAFQIWNRWLGENRYEPDLLSETSKHMLQFLAAWTNMFNKPLLNKNNRNTFCLPQLHDAIPTAHFVILQRNPADIARSLIRAREFVQGEKHGPWGLASQSNHANDPLGYVDDVCEQVRLINERISTAKQTLNVDRLTCCSYEELCDDPTTLVESIAFRSNISLRDYTPCYDDLRRPGSRPLSAEEEVRLKTCLATMNLSEDTAKRSVSPSS